MLHLDGSVRGLAAGPGLVETVRCAMTDQATSQENEACRSLSNRSLEVHDASSDPLLASLTVLAGPMACLAQSTAPAQICPCGRQRLAAHYGPDAASGATRPGRFSVTMDPSGRPTLHPPA